MINSNSISVLIIDENKTHHSVFESVLASVFQLEILDSFSQAEALLSKSSPMFNVFLLLESDSFDTDINRIHILSDSFESILIIYMAEKVQYDIIEQTLRAGAFDFLFYSDQLNQTIVSCIQKYLLIKK